jgi:aminobenzoyl-glutamate utilization protein B
MHKRTARLIVVLLVAVTVSIPAVIADAQTSPARETALQAVDRNKDEIAKIGDAIFSFAEIGMQEVETSKLCAQALREMGFKVELGISGFPTALMATYGSGKPVIALHSEYDAVPASSQTPGALEHKPIVESAPGHGEGHNAGPAVMIGAAFAIKEAMRKHNLPGTIKVFGVPAEEQLLPRPFFVRDGLFTDVDVAFHSHIGNDLSTSYGIRQYAMVSVEYIFHGVTAHAAAAPWMAKSAADAVKLMDIGFDVLREHLSPTHRSHSVIVDAGIQPNVVPDYAKIWWFFRESTPELAAANWAKADKIAEGAALMTGCTWEKNVMSAVLPTRGNKVVAETIQANIERVGMPEWTASEQKLAKGVQRGTGAKETGLRTQVAPLKAATQGTSSNDSGDVTWAVPSGSISFPSNVEGTIGHHWSAAIVPATSIAHKGEVAGAKVLALSVVDLLTHPDIVAKAKKLHAEEVGGTYATLLPADVKPPLGLNREEMEKYRALMAPHYYRPTIKFQ